MWVVILRFQSRDSSMSLCLLNWCGGWKSSEKRGEIFIPFPYQVLYGSCFKYFIVLKLPDTLCLGIWPQRYFTIKCKFISPLELIPFFLPSLRSFLRLMIHSWLLYFFHTSHQNFQQITGLPASVLYFLKISSTHEDKVTLFMQLIC